MANIDSALLIRRPMAAQCGTAALLFGAGDIIAQQAVERKGKEHDVGLVRDYVLLGFQLIGCSLHGRPDSRFTEVISSGFYSLSEIIDWSIGAMFGPAMTKWYQLLNRIQFQTPTKAIVYRVRMFSSRRIRPTKTQKFNPFRCGLTNVY